MGGTVQHPTLGLSSNHDLAVMGSSPVLGSVLSEESAEGMFLPLPLSALILSKISTFFF